MKKPIIAMLSLLAALFLSNQSAFAQDAARVDSTHYKVEFENDQVRVLRISYGAHEKSVMHSHPEGIVIFLSDGSGKFTYPDGSTREGNFKEGSVIWVPATTHQPENTADEPFELIQIEMKSKPKDTEKD